MRPSGGVLGGLAAAALGLAGCDACASHRAPTRSDAGPPPCLTAVSGTGDATFYDATGDGSCSFGPSSDHMVAALNGPDYAHAAWCGACLGVAGPRGTVVVRIVDQCPGCKHGDLDLSREAFAQIAPLSAGRTRVTWREVACPVTGPIVYQLAPRSSAAWTAIQLRNHRYAIAELAARDAGGAFHPLARSNDNYFVAASGLGPGPYALRVTDVHGHALADRDLASGTGIARPGAAQLPSCP